MAAVYSSGASDKRWLACCSEFSGNSHVSSSAMILKTLLVTSFCVLVKCQESPGMTVEEKAVIR